MKKIFALLVVVLFVGATPFYKAELIRVLDGDTVEVTVHVWPQINVTTKIRIRGINAPETHTKDLCEKQFGEESAKYLSEILKAHSFVVVDPKLGKYAGRVVADIHLDTGESVADLMVSGKMALPYSGGRRQKWPPCM